MTEQQIREALRGAAEAPGPADEQAAWRAIQARVAGDTGRRGARTALVAVGLAVAGAAAAVAIVAISSDDRQAVDVGPAESTPIPSAARPERSLAVVVEIDGVQRLDLYDADTGALVTEGLAESPHSISDVSVSDDGTVAFTEEFGDSSTIRTVWWDGSSPPVTPYDLEGAETSSPALTVDGTRVAYVHQGITVPRPSIVVVDTETGEQWAVEAEASIRSISDLAYSPSASELFFVADGQPWVMDTTAEAPINARTLEDGTDGFVVDGHFSADFEVIVLTDEPAFAAVTLDGPSPVQLPAAEGVVAFDVNREETMVLVREDGTVTVAGQLGRGEPLPIRVEGRALDVGW
jgi:hypothetical protein